MSTTTSPLARAATPLDVIALQYANPTRLITVPLGILVAVVIVMAGVTVAVVRAGGSAADLGYSGAVVWSLGGYIVAIGVQAVSAIFPLALALGSTRRTFALGLLAMSAVQAALLTAASLVLLGLEALTGGWFVGARVLGDVMLGGGDPLQLVPIVFLAALSGLTIGGLFGAAWVRLGGRGPTVLAVAIAVVAVAVLLVFPPDFVALGRAFQPWWLAIAAAVVIAVSTTGEYLLLRRASVR